MKTKASFVKCQVSSPLWRINGSVDSILHVIFIFLCLEKAGLFKSHLMPARLTFMTQDDQEYVVCGFLSSLVD